MINEKESISTKGLLPLLVFALVGMFFFFVATLLEEENKETKTVEVVKEVSKDTLEVSLNIDNMHIECKDLDSEISNVYIDDTSIIVKCLNGKEIIWRVEYLGVNKDTK